MYKVGQIITKQQWKDFANYCNSHPQAELSGRALGNGTYEVYSTHIEPTVAELQASKRAERDSAINAIMWRVERYEQQTKLGVETSDSEETYMSILSYVQYLRDFTKQDNWWNLKLKTLEEYETIE